MAFLLSAALAGATSLGCGEDPSGGTGASFPEAPLTTFASESGALDVEVRTAPDQPPARGVVSVEYRITGKDGKPVDGLGVTVVPWMPQMAHGASVKPSVAAMGGGRYVISEVELFMPGTWELRTTFGQGTGAQDPGQDRATLSLQIP